MMSLEFRATKASRPPSVMGHRRHTVRQLNRSGLILNLSCSWPVKAAVGAGRRAQKISEKFYSLD
jgi:hypothetical protein